MLPRISGPIAVDGRVDEAAWEALDPLPLTKYEPDYLGELSEITEIRVGYDDYYVYVSGRLFDSDPDGIRANSLYRDRYAGDDTFAIILDTFNDNDNSLWFFVTPQGVRFDMAVSDDAESGFGRSVNQSWNTFWDAATHRDERGWFAEMRIPYSSLGFQDQDGQVTMGLITYRYIARKNERHIFPAVSPEWGMAFAKPSLAQDVVLSGVRSHRPVYLSPYAVVGGNRTAELNDEETAFSIDERFTPDAGLDIKYNVTSNATLDLTVNTDFAQVEADDQQVNLSRFSLFFPEKRQFFQQRAGIFDYRTGRADRLFHSRQIGLYEEESIRILGGARLVGRFGDWDLGLIDMQTQRSDSLPAENFGVIRLRRRVLNEYSNTGLMVTSRLGDDGSYNVAVGTDGQLRLVGDEYLSFNIASTSDQEINNAGGGGLVESSLVNLSWERQRDEGLHYSLTLARAGRDYEPGMGFETRENYSRVFSRVSYGVFPGPRSRIRQYSPGLFLSTYFRNENGSLESLRLGSPLDFELKSSASFRVDATLQYEDLDELVELPEETTIPTGSYTFLTAEAGYRMPFGRLFRTGINIEGGGFYDGWSVETRIEPTWNVSPHVELGGEYELAIVRFPDRDQAFEAHIVRLRTQIGFNTRVSVNSFVQFSSAADLFAANIRFRFNIREGNDFWIVYNEGVNTSRFDQSPVPPRLDNRSVLVKYTYTIGV